jgi:hypothetical protein
MGLTLDGYDLKKDIWKELTFKKKIEEEKEVWPRMKTLIFPSIKTPSFDNHKESLTINENTVTKEDEYEQVTIWKRKIPTKKKPIYVINRVEKIANEDMEIMMDFLKKHVQGRIDRKPRDVDELIEDIGYYFYKDRRKDILSYLKPGYTRH